MTCTFLVGAFGAAFLLAQLSKHTSGFAGVTGMMPAGPEDRKAPTLGAAATRNDIFMREQQSSPRLAKVKDAAVPQAERALIGS
jgi:hypothetical protein